MKKFVPGFAMLFFAGVSLCGNVSTADTGERTAATNWQVTFVELGSVNCVPCREMQPVMAQVAREYSGVVRVVFCDVWTPEGQPKSREYNIRAIPTQVFLDRNGKEFHRHIGYYSFEEIEKMLTANGIRKPVPAVRKKG
jgi:thioredoxin 1